MPEKRNTSKARMNIKKVMVSSTALDLPEHRPAVRDACVHAGFLPSMMESLPAQDNDAISVCMEMVEQADVYIGIFAHRYGYIPKGHSVSITEMEFQHALDRDRRILPFLMHKDHDIRISMVEDGRDAKRKLKALKKRVCEGRVASFFQSPDQLKGQVVVALTNLLREDLVGALNRHEDEFAQLKMREAANPETLECITELEHKLVKALRRGVQTVLDAAIQPEAPTPAVEARAKLVEGDTESAERLLRTDEESAATLPDLTGAADAALAIAALATSRGDKRAAVAAMQRAARYRPHDFDILDRLGDEYASMGNTSLALASFELARAVADAACASNEGSKRAQRDLSSCHLKIGGMLAAHGQIDNAIAAYRSAMEVLQCLADADPHKAEWQRDLSVAQDRIGEMRAAQGATDEALACYQRALTLRERLNAEVGDIGSQRDLSVSYIKVGEALHAQGCTTEALTSYRKSLVIAERLALDHPEDTELARNVSVSSNRVGDVLAAQDANDDALASYHESLEIAQRLAEAAPDNYEWQRDLSVIQDRIADVLDRQGFSDKALEYYRQSLATAERLVNKDPDNAEWRRDLSLSHDRISEILASQGAFDEALTSCRNVLKMRTTLAANSSDVRFKRDLSTGYARLGKVLADQGLAEDALVAYRQGLAVAELAAAVDQRNPELQRDIVMLCLELRTRGLSAPVAERRRWLKRGLEMSHLLDKLGHYRLEVTHWQATFERALCEL
jgi:tetratricopeptide (TPR) repeat protein